MGIPPRADQEHLGNIPTECPEGGGAFQVNVGGYGHQNLLPWRLHQCPRSGEVVAGREGGWVYGISVSVGWGGAPTSADSLCWSAKVPISGVVFHPECPPKHWEVVPPGLGIPPKILPTGPFPRVHVRSPDTGDHLPASQSDGAVDPQPNYVCLGELDGLLWRHRTPYCSSLGQDKVKDRESLPDPMGGT